MEKDFAENFIFRDRVRAMKNIPLDPNVKRNQWYVSANDATVDDPDALLAGPPWSVLADFHNLGVSEDQLVMEAPDQFPRTVGDNALILEEGHQVAAKCVSQQDQHPYYIASVHR